MKNIKQTISLLLLAFGMIFNSSAQTSPYINSTFSDVGATNYGGWAAMTDAYSSTYGYGTSYLNKISNGYSGASLKHMENNSTTVTRNMGVKKTVTIPLIAAGSTLKYNLAFNYQLENGTVPGSSIALRLRLKNTTTGAILTDEQIDVLVGASAYGTGKWKKYCKNINPLVVGVTNLTIEIYTPVAGNHASNNFFDAFYLDNIVLQQTSLAVTSAKIDPTCASGANGSIAYTVTGAGTAPTYSWYPNTTTTTSWASYLPAGSYTTTVTSSNGCLQKIVALSGIVVNKSVVPATTGTGRKITITATGGVGPYQYKLDGGAYGTSNVFNNVSDGVHTVTVKGANGCISPRAIPAGFSSLAALDGENHMVNDSDEKSVNEEEIFISAEEGINENQVIVYPNPAQEELNFKTSETASVIYMYDATGSYNESINITSETTTINTLKMINGIYFYTVINKDGSVLSRGYFSVAK